LKKKGLIVCLLIGLGCGIHQDRLLAVIADDDVNADVPKPGDSLGDLGDLCSTLRAVPGEPLVLVGLKLKLFPAPWHLAPDCLSGEHESPADTAAEVGRLRLELFAALPTDRLLTKGLDSPAALRADVIDMPVLSHPMVANSTRTPGVSA
jgi:hypothetical protein